MLDTLLDKIKQFLSSRIWPIIVVYIVLISIIVHRLFVLQIVEGQEIVEQQEYLTLRTRYTSGTRGNIYDRNGVLLAENELIYSIVLENSAELETNDEKNAMIYKLFTLLESYGYELELDFAIELDEEGNAVFNVEGTAELRFKKEAMGLRAISNLTEEEAAMSAEEVFEFLCSGNQKYGSMYGISDSYTKEEKLKIMTVRFGLFTLYPQYSQLTVCTDVSLEMVAAIKENRADLAGVEVVQQTVRKYNDALYFAHIMGYTGLITSEELESMNAGKSEEDALYSSSDYIGKTGIERSQEEYLAGTKGVETISINDSGKIVDVQVESEPVAGNDLYLTLDRDLTVAVYHLLEKNIASVLVSKINNGMSYGQKGTNAQYIEIPIYEVYNALISNNVIDIDAFTEEDASDLERTVYGYFRTEQQQVFQQLLTLLASDSTVSNAAAGEEMEECLDYVYSMLGTNGVLLTSEIDREDTVYQEYTEDNRSLSSFLQYAITMNWVDLSVLDVGDTYYSTEELYEKLLDYTMTLLERDGTFDKMIYRSLIFSRNLSGREICLLLFDQGVIEYNEDGETRLRNGSLSPYTFMIQKITNLEITPAQLALEPCSGSVVVTDVNTGEVLAMVSYPSYDNNMLANKIDWEYYSGLLEDASTPLTNRPTQQGTATGSTIKPLIAIAGVLDGVISVNEQIRDLSIFTKIVPSPRCWAYPSSHGLVDITRGIAHSCNYFFYEVGYRMATDENGNYSDSLGLSRLAKYAAMFGFDAKSGVEISEAEPHISTTDAVRSSIGYYHNFTPVQIARYATTLANRGTCYNLTLIDKVVDKDGNVVLDNQATIYNELTEVSDSTWDKVAEGMYQVVNRSGSALANVFSSLSVNVAGKTGTAQVSLNHPHHALFISYAPYEAPEISVTVVMPNGYSSSNAAQLGFDVMAYYFDGVDAEALLTGDVTAERVTISNISD